MKSLLQKISDAAKERFQNEQFPSRKDEYWRFADFDAWSVDALFPFFAGRPSEVGADHEFQDLQDSDGESVVLLHDGQLMDSEVPRGVEVYSAGAAAEEFPQTIENFHSRNRGKFDVLNSTRPDAGILIRVLDGETATLNLKIISKLPVSLANVYVLLGRGARLNLRKTNLSFGGSFSSVKCAYELSEGAVLELASLKYSSIYAKTYEREDFRLGKGSEVIDAVALRAQGGSRQERNFIFDAPYAQADSRMFVSADSDATRDIRTSQIHTARECKSNLEIRAALDGLSNLAFTGLVNVEEGSDKTQAYQSCRSLMLSDRAKSQGSPILEISCNDVACSHGCTVSKPSEEQMFYMMQRGLDERAARSLIVRSFAEVSFAKITDREFVDSVMSRILE